jgi:hypothetical protein
MSANFVQVSTFGGGGGRTQTLVPGVGTQLFQFAPTGLPGVTDGGDRIYAERIRVRVTGNITRNAGGAATTPAPNWEQLAQAFGKVHVFSPDLQEIVPLGHNTVPLLANHDQFTTNGQRPITRKRSTEFGTTGISLPIEYEFEIPFARDYGVRPTDFCPWLPLLDQGVIEFELRPSNALATFGETSTGWTMSGNWTAEVVIDWFTDKQSLIHAPVGSRIYQPVTAGPEFILKNVGGAKGYDGVVAGCRLATLSWLAAGATNPNFGAGHDNGFYAAYSPGSGPSFGSNLLTRIDLPWRMQKSINAVTAYLGAFLADQGPVRFRANLSAGATVTDNDLANWPYTMDPAMSNGTNGRSLLIDALDFFPLIWPDHAPRQKISDMQKVNGDLTFTADFANAVGLTTHLFRTDEVLAFSRVKVLDIMDRMGQTHVDRGGVWRYIVKYGDPKQANVSTQWGMPLKIVTADQPGAL